ncbi:MAG TPA: MaoC family dehydratase N-terminal domain-containing protein [Bacillales bacterium]|nr:MaoC family dehydratase N-terminal domain-containing protein [Bacillales bacterium]
MKTKDFTILFNKDNVHQFIKLIGDQNPIYQNIELARSHGYQTIPLPPTMPMIAYKEMETPWKMNHPVILRKQECVNHQIMYIDQPYIGHISIDDHFQRKQYTFIKQTLRLYELHGILCFEGISHLMAGGLV